MNYNVYGEAKRFLKNYPITIGWRIKKHCNIIEKHLNSDEVPRFVFVAQKNNNPFDWISTNVVVLTNKRILLAHDRIISGYSFTSITPDMFNDLKIVAGIIWGKAIIDTVKEVVYLSNIDKKALPIIENEITEYMMEEKKKYKTTD